MKPRYVYDLNAIKKFSTIRVITIYTEYKIQVVIISIDKKKTSSLYTSEIVESEFWWLRWNKYSNSKANENNLICMNMNYEKSDTYLKNFCKI